MTKNIVIVGGGYAGVMIANSLEKALTKAKDQEYRIILVEKVNKMYKDTLIFNTKHAYKHIEIPFLSCYCWSSICCS